MVDADVERIYTIPLREPKQGKRSHRAPRALRAIRSYLNRHLKSEKVWIDAAVNEKLWERGKFKIPSKIRVRAIKFADGVVEVSLPEEEAKSIREQLKAKRTEAASQAVLAPAAEGELEEGAGAEGAAATEGEAPKPAAGEATRKPKDSAGTEKKDDSVSEKPEGKGKSA